MVIFYFLTGLILKIYMKDHQIKSFMLNQSITKPEQLPQKTEQKLILFAWLTWTYRLLMFSGIAIAVFILFPIKFIGLLVSTFILFQLVFLPFLKEILTYLPYHKKIGRASCRER